MARRCAHRKIDIGISRSIANFLLIVSIAISRRKEMRKHVAGFDFIQSISKITRFVA